MVELEDFNCEHCYGVGSYNGNPKPNLKGRLGICRKCKRMEND